jgi:hypothetical protein
MDTTQRPTLAQLAEQTTDPNYQQMMDDLINRVATNRDNAPQVAAFNSSI